ncbi:autotransporter domain-containing protein [Nitratireductor pacificus]|uniref:autotransporter family protein n=1 Tax=Nitratireductor pacificus TaxID=1231180 RepID=UPI0002FBE0B4|nr:autotransporter domain-containing protein [Nitratireductor pacificus]
MNDLKRVAAGCLPLLLTLTGGGWCGPGEGGKSPSASDGRTGRIGAIVTGDVVADVEGGTGGRGGGTDGTRQPGKPGVNGGGAGGLGGGRSLVGSDDLSGGGGGGGGEALGFNSSVIIRDGVTVRGGHGGDGGAGAQEEYGGSGEPGGGGGGGDAASGTGALRVEGRALGGTGGTGGNGFVGGGRGGNGGNGVSATSSDIVVEATGTVRGGNGGVPGVSRGGRLFSSPGGNGGHGIDGSYLTIRNKGLIRGGNGGRGSFSDGGAGIHGENLIVENAGRIQGGITEGHVGRDGQAIRFTHGTNQLHLYTDSGGPGIEGEVWANGANDTLVLHGVMSGGHSTASFDVSKIGAREQYRGFEAFEKRGNSTWRLTGSGAQAWSLHEGVLIGDSRSLQGNIVNEGRLVFDQSFSGNYAGSVSGAGGLEKTGDETLILSGDFSAFTGETLVSGGLLVVGDQAAFRLDGGIRVTENGTVGGFGTLGDAFIGGIHAPGLGAQGNGIGIQKVDGDYTTRGTLSIDANPQMLDRIVVAGNVDIAGSTLELVPVSQQGWGADNGPFVIIDKLSAGAVAGTFSEVTESAIFLDAHVDYAAGDGNDVSVTLRRNSIAFEDAAHTENHEGVAASVEMLGGAHPLWQAVVSASDIPALHSGLDSLSGELYGSVQSALVANGHFLRATASNRIRRAFADTGAEHPPRILPYGPADRSIPDLKEAGSVDFWGAAYGAWAKTDGDGRAAAMDQSTGGFFLGVDTLLGGWRVGLLAGYGRTNVGIDAQGATSRSSDYHLGAYAGRRFGAVALRGGLAYTWHEIDARRDVFVNGFRDGLSAEYGAGTFQAFGELGYRVETSGLSFEPFVSLAHVSHHADALSERGGAAALEVAGGSMNTTFTTLGLRAEAELDLASMDVTAYAVAGWQHAFGDKTATSVNTFSGGVGFPVAGSAIAGDSLLFEAGLDIVLSEQAALDVSYQGQMASGLRQHGLNGTLRIQF